MAFEEILVNFPYFYLSSATLKEVDMLDLQWLVSNKPTNVGLILKRVRFFGATLFGLRSI